MDVTISLPLHQWERILGDLKRDIDSYSSEVLMKVIQNQDSTYIQALNVETANLYDTIATGCGLPTVVPE